jgi:hypothetical protein
MLKKLNFSDIFVQNFILISYLIEFWRMYLKRKMNEFEKNIMIFEFDEIIEGFNEIRVDSQEISDILNSNLIYIIVNPFKKEILIYHGYNSNVRMKFIATQEAPKIRDKFGIDFKILAVDEGDDISEIKEIIEIINK